MSLGEGSSAATDLSFFVSFLHLIHGTIMLKLLNLLPYPSSKLLSNYILSLSTKLPPPFSHHPTTTMSMSLRTHAFAGNPLRSRTPNRVDPLSPAAAHETLKARIAEGAGESVSVNLKVLPFRNGRPLAAVASSDTWRLAWMGLEEVKGLLGANLSADSFVYLGSDADEDSVYWAIDLSRESGLVAEFGAMKLCFVELRTLMVATDWVDLKAMSNLAIAGHVSWFSLLHLTCVWNAELHGICWHDHCVVNLVLEIVFQFSLTISLVSNVHIPFQCVYYY